MSQAKPSDKIRVSKKTWLPFRASIVTRLKAADDASRIMLSLNQPFVDEAAYFALPNANARNHHAADDSEVMTAIMKSLHHDDLHYVAAYAANSRLNAVAAGQPGHDPTVDAWWPSPGRKSFDVLSAVFGAVNSTAVAALRSSLYSMDPRPFAGDLPSFESAFKSARDHYMTAAVTAGQNVASLDLDLALHLVEVLDKYDHELYKTAMAMRRQSPANTNTVDSVFEAATLEFDARPARREQSAAPSVLVTGAPAAGVDTLEAQVRLLTTAVSSLVNNKTGGGKPGARRRDRPPLAPADKALLEKCKANGLCFQFLKGRCYRGDGCNFKHSLPAGSSAQHAAAGAATSVAINAVSIEPVSFDGVHILVNSVDDGACDGKTEGKDPAHGRELEPPNPQGVSVGPRPVVVAGDAAWVPAQDLRRRPRRAASRTAARHRRRVGDALVALVRSETIDRLNFIASRLRATPRRLDQHRVLTDHIAAHPLAPGPVFLADGRQLDVPDLVPPRDGVGDGDDVVGHDTELNCCVVGDGAAGPGLECLQLQVFDVVDVLVDYVSSGVYDPHSPASVALFGRVATADSVVRVSLRAALRRARASYGARVDLRTRLMPDDCGDPWMQKAPSKPLVLSVDAAPGSDALEDGDVFVVDTGASGVVVSSAEVLSLASSFTQCAMRFVRSNSHSDTISGSVDLDVTFSAQDDVAVPLRLRALVVPASRWNILPPVFIPGFLSASIAKDGVLSIHLQGLSSPLVTEPYKGLQVLRLRKNVVALLVAAPPALVVSPPPSATLMRLHESLGHASISTIHELIRSGRVSVPDPATRSLLLASRHTECRHCVLASHPSTPKVMEGHEPSDGDTRGLWAVDVFGPFEPSAGGNRYAAVWLSHFRNYAFLTVHKAKSDVALQLPSSLEHFVDAARDELRVLRSDGGAEFFGFADFCDSQGVVRQLTSPGSSFQNGRVERLIRTLRAKAGAALSRSGLPRNFWAEALAYAVYVHNRLPPARGGPSPHECVHGSPPALRLLQPFGCLAMVRVHQPAKSRLANRSRPSVYLGPALGTKDGHRIIHIDTNAVATSRNCVFFPAEFPFNSASAPSSSLLVDRDDVVDAPGSRVAALPPPRIGNPFAVLQDLDDDAALAVRRPARVTAKPAPAYDPSAIKAQRLHDRQKAVNAAAAAAVAAAVAGVGGASVNVAVPFGPQEEVLAEEEPSSLAAALATPHRAEWVRAVGSELSSHALNGTWEPVAQVPKGRSPLPSKWVFKVKYTETGAIDKFKARLVAKGFRQRSGVDYYDTFAPTLRVPTFRALCALSCHRGFVIHQMDVATAFLIAELQEEVYMVLPEQALVDEHLPDFASPRVVRLRKTLYGLKQSPRAYYTDFCGTLGALGFARSTADPCLWVRVANGILRAAIAFWVDDCAICAAPGDVAEIKLALQKTYRMTDGGLARWFLSVRICQDVGNRRITLDQGPSIERLLVRYGFSLAKPAPTPCEGALPALAGMPPADQEEIAFMSNKPYRSLVGSLLYLLFTRPDLAFAVGQLSRYLTAPRRIHWLAIAACRVLRYLRGTTNLGVSYAAPEEEEEPVMITGYSDADWAGDRDSRRSTTGFIFMMCGGPIAWKTKLQPSVALSTTEAEIMALAAAVQEGVWLRRLAIDLCFANNFPLTLYEDNQGAIALMKDHRFSDRSKHIDIRYFFLRDHLGEDGLFQLTYCDTTNMLADILTKGLGRVAFLHLVELIGMTLVRI